MGLGESLYARAPVWAQNLGITAFGAHWHWLRFGPGFSRHARAYTEREYLTPAQWQEWQHVALRKVLGTAAAHVPYYRTGWSAGEKRAAREGVLERLPLLGKAPLREDPHLFTRDDMQVRRPLRFHTSGSTGTPVTAIYTVDELRASQAVREVRSAAWAGVSFRQPRATFSGRMVVANPESTGPFHRFNTIERQVYFSAFHLRQDTAQRYIEALHRHRTRWMTGYAVSFYLLARRILELGLEVPPLRAVITTSEKVTQEMRETMETAFRCKIFEEYGTVENALFASECEHHRLHVSPDVGIVEILRPDGTPCGPGETGEVVTTCVMRSYQPFIRYRLGDLACWDPEPCPCGRAMPVLQEVVGRLEDVVTGPDGRQMVRFHGIFVDQPHIREGQIIQEALDRIRVRLVPTEAFSPDDEADVVARVRARLGSGVTVLVDRVDQIPRSPAGKFRAVVSLLDRI